MMPTKTAESGRTFSSHYVDVHVILRRDGLILLGRRHRELPVFPGAWQVPAGLLEEGEPASAGAAREVFEETGVSVAPNALRFAHVMHHVSTHRGSHRIALFYEAEQWTGEISNPEPMKCDGWEWVKPTDLPEPMAPYLRVALQHIADGVPSSEFNWTGDEQADRGGA